MHNLTGVITQKKFKCHTRKCFVMKWHQESSAFYARMLLNLFKYLYTHFRKLA